jgi:hypothetical protein
MTERGALLRNELSRATLPLSIDGVDLAVATLHRSGPLAPIADIARHAAFDGHAVVAFDAPGCGETRCSELSRVSIPFLSIAVKLGLPHFV